MTDHVSYRARLLTGASIILVLSGFPAAAQSVSAHAPRAAVNRQSMLAGTEAEAYRAGVRLDLAGVQTGDASVADNDVVVLAHANDAQTGLVDDGDDPAGMASPSSLSIGGGLVSADADSVVASSQTLSDAPVEALDLASDTGLSAGTVSSAALAVSSNATGASAIGNNAVDRLAIAGAAGKGGAIVSAQLGDAASGVSALDAGVVQLSADSAMNSRFDLSGNRAAAAATGNRIDDAFQADIGDVRVRAAGEAGSSVPANMDAAAVTAPYASLGSQTVSGKVAATIGTDQGPSPVALDLKGGVEASTLAVDGNDLSATATANRSSRTLDLNARAITAAAPDDGPAAIATLTGIQRDLGGDLVAATNGGAAVRIGGDLSGSTLDLSRNTQSAAAAVNRADGNLLNVAADTIDSSDPGQADVAAVMTGDDGAASVTSAFGVQNVQQMAGVSAIATMTANGLGIDVGGTIDHASIVADTNSADARATANNAVNGLAVSGNAIRSSAGLGNSQSADGQLRALIGTPAARAGVAIVPAGGITASTVKVTDNSLAGSTVGNEASNSLTLFAGTLGIDRGIPGAVSGGLDSGDGAAADMALANAQKLGQSVVSQAGWSSLASKVMGAFTIDGGASVDGSALSLDRNDQRATVIGNNVLDRLSLVAGSNSGTAGPAGGSALASRQAGNASLIAVSDTRLAVSGDAADSTISVTGNSNQAVAAVNVADNGMHLSTGRLGGALSGPARASLGASGSVTIAGDHVLSNEQAASGDVNATAQTDLRWSDGGAGLSGSRLTIADNGAVADASANQAVNAVSVDALPATSVSAGLVSSQTNDAAIKASSVLAGGAALANGGATAVPDGSTVAIGGNLSQASARGNSADNEVAYTGGSMSAGLGSAPAIDAIDPPASAPVLLVSQQRNDGAIDARATANWGGPLNTSGSATSSTFGMTGNKAVASAYGNEATNRLAIGGPGAMLVSNQSNSAPVSAAVIGTITGSGDARTAGTTSIAGNQLGATAVGNVVTSTMAAGR